MAGEQPDPEFKAFFHGEWKELMDAVTVPGLPYASWDRKAAYLLWVMGAHYDAETPWHWRDVLRSVFKVPENTAPPQTPGERMVSAAKEMRASVGKEDQMQFVKVNAQPAPVNHIQYADCLPTGEGVALAFDSADWR